MSSTIANPWLFVPKRPDFVLPDDRLSVREFNKTARWPNCIALDVLPEPFFGPRDAPVVVLLLNPGLGPDTHAHHRRVDFARALRADIAAEHAHYHFHLVDSTSGPGHIWWTGKCRELAEELSDPDYTRVASGMLSVQYSPYHSASFGNRPIRLQSQQFAFSLVRAAIRRRALIVCLRGVRLWQRAIPELTGYRRFEIAKNPRAGSLSLANIVNYKAIVGALR